IDSTKSLRCGYLQFRPDFLQTFNTSKWLLLILCFYSVTMSMQIIGFRGVVIPQVEKRFNMTSAYIGSIMSTVDISGGICGVWLAYCVGQQNKGKWVGYGVVITALGSLIFIIPHFVAGPYYYGYNAITQNSTAADLCSFNSSGYNTSAADCTSLSDSGNSWIYPTLFVVGLIFTGVGASIQYNAGISYLDENVSPRASPLYIGIYHTMGIVGPSLGYVFGGVFSNVFIDWPASPKDLTPDDPRWIGAWWLGYLICGLFSLVSAIFIIGFPYRLPSYEKSKQKRQALATKTSKAPTVKDDSSQLTAFLKSFYCIISNRIFLLAAVGLTIDQIPVIGLATFLPKFIQSQSGFSLLVSTTIGGAGVVISAAIGQILGGYMMKRWNLIGSQISRYCFYVCIVNVLFSFVLLIHCNSPVIAGINAKYPSPLANVTMLAICHQNCACNANVFKPVCGADKLSYISPCLAGCRGSSELHLVNKIGNYAYSNCSCVNAFVEQTAKAGLCPMDACPALYLLLAGIILLVIITFLSFSPTISIILRSLPDNQTAFGMGIEGLIFRIGGGLLGPLIFGFLMDNSCTFWKEDCGKKQFCWQYDNAKLSLYTFLAVVLVKGLKLVVYGFLWY
ncbi:uncharacterized protein TRIADDRAFT_1100, partial [Trichoplax adhaerens]